MYYQTWLQSLEAEILRWTLWDAIEGQSAPSPICLGWGVMPSFLDQSTKAGVPRSYSAVACYLPLQIFHHSAGETVSNVRWLLQSSEEKSTWDVLLTLIVP